MAIVGSVQALRLGAIRIESSTPGSSVRSRNARASTSTSGRRGRRAGRPRQKAQAAKHKMPNIPKSNILSGILKGLVKSLPISGVCDRTIDSNDRRLWVQDGPTNSS